MAMKEQFRATQTGSRKAQCVRCVACSPHQVDDEDDENDMEVCDQEMEPVPSTPPASASASCSEMCDAPEASAVRRGRPLRRQKMHPARRLSSPAVDKEGTDGGGRGLDRSRCIRPVVNAGPTTRVSGFSPKVSGYSTQCTKLRGRRAATWISHEAPVSAVHRGSKV